MNRKAAADELVRIAKSLVAEESPKNGWYKDDEGTRRHYLNDQLHSKGGKPAVVGKDGYRSWFKNGRLSRGADMPAIVTADGSRHWFVNGIPHRSGNLPAVEHADGSKEWYQNGQRVK